MPCRDYEDWSECSTAEAVEKLNKVTEMLCSVMTVIESDGKLNTVKPSVRAWWQGHKKEDEKRLLAEVEAQRKAQVKANALKKLSPEEKRLLGV